MKFIIRELNWHKRRAPTKEPKPVSVKIPDFQKIANHSCDVFTMYDDGVERKLLGRVTQNQIKGTWAVNGIANGGFCVFAELDESGE